jgi:hypothetical protein
MLRIAIRIFVIVGLAACARPTAAVPSDVENPVVIENAASGTTAWMTSEAGRAIEGYTSEASALPGETVSFHVSVASGARYRIEIYRLGWYQGAGGRLIACLPACHADSQGTPRSVPAPDPSTGQVAAAWPVTDEIVVSEAWTSGYYTGKLLITTGPDAGRSSSVPFVVRPGPSRRPEILVQVPVNTWQAYNNWGGRSLYGFNSDHTGPAVKISFDRPWGPAQTMFDWEYPLVRFLERHPFDVAYQTDVDTHRAPDSLLAPRLVIVNGHGEYWSKRMRDAFEGRRDRAGNLAFLGANIGTWQTRYEDAERTLVAYRSRSTDPVGDPAEETVRFRDLRPPRPECEILGVQFQGGMRNSGDSSRDFHLTPEGALHPFVAGMGLQVGSAFRDLVGYEWDTVVPGCTEAEPTRLLEYTGGPASAATVSFVSAAGGAVFSTGSLQYNWALDDYGHHPHADGRIQQLTINALDTLLGRPIGTTALRTGTPDLTILTGPRTFSGSRDGTFTFASKTAGVFYECAIDTTAPAGCAPTTPYRGLSDGSHVFQVIATGSGGGQAVETWQWTVDTKPPATFFIRKPRPQPVLDTPRLDTFAFRSSEPDAGFQCAVDAGRWKGCARRHEISGLKGGRHRVRVRAVDRAGNPDPTPASHVWRVVTSGLGIVRVQRRAPANGLVVLIRARRPGRVSITGDLAVPGGAIRAGEGRRHLRRGMNAVPLRLSRAGARVLRRRPDDGLRLRLTFSASGRTVRFSPVVVTVR